MIISMSMFFFAAVKQLDKNKKFSLHAQGTATRWLSNNEMMRKLRIKDKGSLRENPISVGTLTSHIVGSNENWICYTCAICLELFSFLEDQRTCSSLFQPLILPAVIYNNVNTGKYQTLLTQFEDPVRLRGLSYIL